MPPPLPDELLEEVLLRLPPENPAGLVHAALVSRRWCRIVSDVGFRRRFREFHRRPPMLGMLCNLCAMAYDKIDTAGFIPTTAAFCFPRTYFRHMRVLDARHGRVLFERAGDGVLGIWDPITGKVRRIPFPRKKANVWSAAVLCSAAACDHLDCHNGPFLVVCLCINRYEDTFVYTYSSEAAAWSKPVGPQQTYFRDPMSSVLVGNALYFGIDVMENTTLKYNFELRQVSMIQLPSSLSLFSLMSFVLTTTEDGGLGLVTKDDCKLYVWSWNDTHEVDGKWERRIVELKAVFHVDVDVDVTKLAVIGSGVGTIFMRMGNEIYTFDLKTYKVKKVYEGRAHNIFPYMSFYTPALGGTCTGVGPNASC